MSTFQKYLSILLATAMLVGTIGITARHHSHRSGYRGRRGWNGYRWGFGLGYGYNWPYYGYGLGYPGYYARPSYAKDNAGQTYWMIYNQSLYPLRVQSDRDETVIPAGAMKKLYRKGSFTIRVIDKGRVKTINTRQHNVALSSDKFGKPYFKL